MSSIHANTDGIKEESPRDRTTEPWRPDVRLALHSFHPVSRDEVGPRVARLRCVEGPQGLILKRPDSTHRSPIFPKKARPGNGGGQGCSFLHLEVRKTQEIGIRW